jgi:hypothetical protein
LKQILFGIAVAALALAMTGVAEARPVRGGFRSSGVGSRSSYSRSPGTYRRSYSGFRGTFNFNRASRYFGPRIRPVKVTPIPPIVPFPNPGPR